MREFRIIFSRKNRWYPYELYFNIQVKRGWKWFQWWSTIVSNTSEQDAKAHLAEIVRMEKVFTIPKA
jgi:hypothetical protein